MAQELRLCPSLGLGSGTPPTDTHKEVLRWQPAPRGQVWPRETAPESLVPAGAGSSLARGGHGRSCVLQSPAIPKDGDSPPPGDPSQGCSVPGAPEHPKLLFVPLSLIAPSGPTTQGLTPSSLTLLWGCSVGPSFTVSPPWPHPPGAGEHPLGPLWFLPIPLHGRAQIWTLHCRGVPHGAPHQHQPQGCWGCPQAQGMWGFSLAKPACQGSWVINISLHTQPGIFLARRRAAEAFPQLFQRPSLRGVQAGPAPHGQARWQLQGCAGLSPALPVSQAPPYPARLPHRDGFTPWGDSRQRNPAAAFAF